MVSIPDDARRSWNRLLVWVDRTATIEALTALGDVERVRRVLDRVEVNAVSRARKTGRSWAEIGQATGISRQAAWEKWSDVDGSRAADDSPDVGDRSRACGRRGSARVPDVVGVAYGPASRILDELRLLPKWAETGTALESATVVRQYPEPDVRIPFGSTVKLWCEGGGEAGVREPRRPHPPLREASTEADSDDCVGG